MKKAFLVISAACLLATVACAQEQGSQAVRGVGTINQMSATPDQNQRLVGEQPLTNTGGPTADVPDNTDRVNGKAYPTGSNAAAASGPQAVQTALDPRSGQPVPDTARLAAAQQAKAGAKRPDLDPSRVPHETLTASPGAKAKTKANTGGQSNDQRK